MDAGGILALLDGLQAAQIDFHSLMVLRHGQVVAEGWWAPYQADVPHLLYSLSKSFTSTAIGIAQAEGLLSIDDRVVSFFPEKLPAQVSPYVERMKIRHLLAMASGHAEDTWDKLSGGGDIVRGFLSLPPDQEPGSLFCYNQGCTYTLSAIITKLTGQRLVDYLRPRLLDPLGIGEARWVQSEEGIDQGFSGLHVTTESIAKLGQLHLQNGQWDGQQLFGEDYLAQAHSKQVDNRWWSDNPDWQQGYGFQFWMCRNQAYRGDGAFGQFCVVVPGADAVIACTAQTADMQAQIDLFWEHLLPAFSAGATADAGTERALAERLGHLSTATVEAASGGPSRPVAFDRIGEPPAYAESLSAIRVEPTGQGPRLVVIFDGSEHCFDLRPGRWASGELGGSEVRVNGGWVGPEELHADVVFLTTPHRLQLRARAADRPTVELSWQAGAPLRPLC